MNLTQPTTGLVIAGAYRLDFPLGEGGFGTVWRATELAGGRVVAIKFLRGGFDRQTLARFDREAESLTRVAHPNCVALLAYGYSNELVGPYLVTEFVDGETLAAWGRRSHAVAVVVDVVAQIASALDAAHRRGIVHRDLKPTNVMIVPTPEGPVVKVVDFGIAKLSGVEHRDVTKTGEVIGTPGYMSPEQLRAEPDVGPPTDLYCLGAILYELLAGRPVFSAATAFELAMLHLIEPPPPLGPEVPPALNSLVLRLLQKSPRDRPRHASEVWRELEAVLGRNTKALAPNLAPPPPPAGNARAWVAAVVVFVASAAALAFWWSAKSEQARPAPRIPRALTRPVPSPAPAAVLADPPAPIAAPLPQRDDSLSSGCDIPRTPGHKRVFDVGLSRVPLRTYLPKRYDPRRGHSLLVIFHSIGGGAGPDSALADLPLEAFADTHDVILLAVDTYGVRTQVRKGGWDSPGRQHAWESIQQLKDLVCVDVDRIFLMGFVGGGRAAEQLACDERGIAGVITFATRRDVDESRCQPVKPVPHLALFPTRDAADPVGGGGPLGAPCGRSTHITSVKSQEAENRAANRCTDERTLYMQHGKSVCHTWSCEALTVSCRLDGGREWGVSTPGECAGPVADFPYADLIWRFMEETLPRERE